MWMIILKIICVLYVIVNALLIFIQSSDLERRHRQDKMNLSSDPSFHDSRTEKEKREDILSNEKKYDFLTALKFVWLIMTLTMLDIVYVFLDIKSN